MFVVYQNIRDIDGYIIKTIEHSFENEILAQLYADECERMVCFRDIWITVEEEE
jgi:hypothetical protein